MAVILENRKYYYIIIVDMIVQYIYNCGRISYIVSCDKFKMYVPIYTLNCTRVRVIHMNDFHLYDTIHIYYIQ